MRGQIEERLAALRSEAAKGQQMLAQLEREQRNAEATMLRIAGAIQVLEEVLAGEGADSGAADAGPAAADETLVSDATP